MTGPERTEPPQDPAAVVDALDARVVDLEGAAAAGGVDLDDAADDDADEAQDHVEQVDGSPEPPD